MMYDNFTMFAEVKRKKTQQGVMCIDRVWWDGRMIFSLSLDYTPFYRGARDEVEAMYNSFKEVS